jgi:hypothetical protein
MPGYDTLNFDPPAPVAHVTLRNPDNGVTISDVHMLRRDWGDSRLLICGLSSNSPNGTIGLDSADRSKALSG